MIDGFVVKLSLWDCSGATDALGLRATWMHAAAGVVVVFDVTSRKSFAAADALVSSIRGHPVFAPTPITLVATKTDVPQAARIVSVAEAVQFARSFDLPYFEVSALTGRHVPHLCHYLARVPLTAAIGITPGLPAPRSMAPHGYTDDDEDDDAAALSDDDINGNGNGNNIGNVSPAASGVAGVAGGGVSVSGSGSPVAGGLGPSPSPIADSDDVSNSSSATVSSSTSSAAAAAGNNAFAVGGSSVAAHSAALAASPAAHGHGQSPLMGPAALIRRNSGTSSAAIPAAAHGHHGHHGAHGARGLRVAHGHVELQDGVEADALAFEVANLLRDSSGSSVADSHGHRGAHGTHGTHGTRGAGAGVGGRVHGPAVPP